MHFNERKQSFSFLTWVSVIWQTRGENEISIIAFIEWKYFVSRRNDEDMLVRQK